MSFNEIVTLSISVVALIASITALSLQYSIRNDFKFRLTDISLVSLDPNTDAPRTFVITFNLSVFNLGSRPASIESVTLRVIKGEADTLKANPPSECEEGGQFIVPIERKNYSQMSVPATVVGSQEIFSEELVFDLFFHNKTANAVNIEGLACVTMRFSNSAGTTAQRTLPIAILKVDLVRPNTIAIEFHTDAYDAVGTLHKVF